MSQHCPICGSEGAPNPRYPDYVCEARVKRAVDASGRKVVFSNESGLSGGFVSHHIDEQGNEEQGQEHRFFIDGKECWADEAHLGGIVAMISSK